MSSARSSDLRALLLLLALVVVLFADVLFLGSGFFFRDLFRYHFPLKHVVREVVAHGEFPWWNRFISAGQPMAANPAYEIFYPPQWLIFVGSYRFGFNLHILFHIALALAGMYALLRTLGLREAVSLFGAMSFGLGAYFLSTTATLPMMFVWSWAPLAGCLLLRWLDDPTPRRFALVSLVLAMQMLVGEPVALVEVWLLLSIAVWWKTRRVRGVVALALAAVAIAAVQLVPAIDHVRDSARSRGFDYATVVDYSMSPLRPIELVEPHAFGIADPHEPKVWGGSGYGRRREPYVASLYCGIAVAIFALAGFLARMRGSAVAAAICVVSYLVALGDGTPLFRLLYKLGIVGSLRYPEKFIAAGLATLVVFAAFAAQGFLDGDVRVRRAAKMASIAVTVIAVLPLLWSLLPGFTPSFLRLWQLPDAAAPLAAFARTEWLIAFAFAAAWCALIVFDADRRTRYAPALALVLLIADLGLLSREHASRMPADFFTPPPIVTRLEPDHDAYAIFHRASWVADPNFRRFANRSMHWTSRNALRPFTANAWGLHGALEYDYDETDLLPTHDLLEAMKRYAATGAERWSDPFVTMSNVRYIVDYADFDEAMRGVAGDITAVLPIRVRRVLADQPRYWFAQRIVSASGIDDVVHDLQQNPDARLTAFAPLPPRTPAPARVLGVHETSSGATIDVESTGDALLVMTVTRHKYWRVTVDGRDAAIVPANLAYQAVAVPAGKHRVAMRYRNPLVIAGGAVSGLALCAAAIAIARSPRRRRPRNGS